MYFQHSSRIWAEHPRLVAGVVLATGVTGQAETGSRIAALHAAAEKRLADGPPAEFAEIRAWRGTFARMGLKPTQYRCAAESLLRRFAKEQALPRIHPVIDLCNAVSLAYAIPVGVFDLNKISGSLEVRHARGDESYLTFAGGTERPAAGEVIFADADGRAHARRWTNRQSGYSAVRDTTTTVLVIAEAMHTSAATDIPRLTATVADALREHWPIATRSATLHPSSPRFDLAGHLGRG